MEDSLMSIRQSKQTFPRISIPVFLKLKKKNRIPVFEVVRLNRKLLLGSKKDGTFHY